MTRINAGVSPNELHRVHLIAEYRETLMVPAALRRSLRTKHPESIIKSIPNEFTLNKGHVKFFYNKLKYLSNRYESLKLEMRSRGYHVAEYRNQTFDGFPLEFYSDWKENSNARNLVMERINLRISQKPHLYK